MIQKLRATLTPFPDIPEDSPYQKALCVIPFLGEPLSYLSQLSLEKQIAATQNPLKQRELRRIQGHYVIADSLRYPLYWLLLAYVVPKYFSLKKYFS